MPPIPSLQRYLEKNERFSGSRNGFQFLMQIVGSLFVDLFCAQSARRGLGAQDGSHFVSVID